MDDNQKGAIGILGALAAAFVAMKHKQSKAQGSFAENDEALLPSSGNYLQEMIVSQRGDPFLGQAVTPYRGRNIARPEYTLMFDLVDADLIPLPDMLITTPERPYGPTNMEAMQRHFRPDPRGLIKVNQIGYLTSKSQFFAMVDILKPMIQEQALMVDLVEGQDGTIGLKQEGIMLGPSGTGIARPQDVNARHYRINLVALASQHGRPISDPILPFSGLFHSFEMYSTHAWATHCYDMAFQKLIEFMNMNQINTANSRRLM